MTEKRKLESHHDYEDNILLFILCSSVVFALVLYVSIPVFYRMEKLAERSFALAPFVSDSNALVLRKEAGLLAGGYKIVVKTSQAKLQAFYVDIDDYLSVNADDKTCIKYKVINGDMQGIELCKTKKGEK